LGSVTSFGGMQATIDNAVSKGLIVIGAAGNYNMGFIVEPANLNGCIAVAGCDINRQAWKDSAWGSKVLVTAPAHDVVVASFRENTSTPWIHNFSGTSYSAAHLAGAAALWLSHWGVETIRNKYRQRVGEAFQHVIKAGGYARPRGWDTANYGVGILDIEALLQVPLPAASKVGRGGPVARTPLEQLTALVPELPAGDVEERLDQLFDGAGDLEVEVEQHYAELASALQDGEIRSALFEKPAESAKASAAGSSEGAPAQLPTLLSPTLAQKLSGEDAAGGTPVIAKASTKRPTKAKKGGSKVPSSSTSKGTLKVGGQAAGRLKPGGRQAWKVELKGDSPQLQAVAYAKLSAASEESVDVTLTLLDSEGGRLTDDTVSATSEEDFDRLDTDYQFYLVGAGTYVVRLGIDKSSAVGVEFKIKLSG
jgi:hypothetical protein